MHAWHGMAILILTTQNMLETLHKVMSITMLLLFQVYITARSYMFEFTDMSIFNFPEENACGGGDIYPQLSLLPLNSHPLWLKASVSCACSRLWWIPPWKAASAFWVDSMGVCVRNRPWRIPLWMVASVFWVDGMDTCVCHHPLRLQLFPRRISLRKKWWQEAPVQGRTEEGI